MNTELLITFIILNSINVIIQTIKSLVTVKCGKLPAALVNAAAYGFYTIVVVYMVCDLPLLWKVGVVGSCNFVGVYIVKWFEEKCKKDKLWKVELTIPAACESLLFSLENLCVSHNLPYNYIDINKYFLVNIYCSTQAQSLIVSHFIEKHRVKYFVGESKQL